MAIALLPLAISAFIGFHFLNSGVIHSYRDVSQRLHAQIAPLQILRLEVHEAIVPVDEFLEDGDPAHQAAYRTTRNNVEDHFARLLKNMDGDPNVKSLLSRARADWSDADKHAMEILNSFEKRGTPQITSAILRFHSEITATVDKLQTGYMQINASVDKDFRKADLYYERTLWIIGISIGVSLCAIIISVTLVSRMLAASVDRLVEGATRIADGDRNHRIEVTIPPELSRVADEFNHMISRIKDTEEALEQLARRDSLTGLPNRREFDEALDEMYACIERHFHTWAVLAIDIDHFKNINDNHGHAAGDAVLKSVSQTMRANLRPYDKLFRTGGEEFTALLPETDESTACYVAERLREAIASNTVEFIDNKISITVSIGIAVAAPGHSMRNVLHTADTALYEAKENGRNQVFAGKPHAKKALVAV